MTVTEFISLPDERHDGLICIASDDSVWLTTTRSRLSPVAWFRRLSFPFNKRKWLILTTKFGKVRVLAICISTKYVRLG